MRKLRKALCSMPDTGSSVSLCPSGKAWKEGMKEKVVLEAVNGLVSEGEWMSDSSFSRSKEKYSRVVS